MKLYLRPVGDGTQYSDSADYLANPPFAARADFEWVEGDPPEGAMPYSPNSTAQQILQMFEALPIETQIAQASAFALAKHYGEKGDLEKLKAIIAAVQPAPSDKPVQEAMLEKFQE